MELHILLQEPYRLRMWFTERVVTQSVLYLISAFSACYAVRTLAIASESMPKGLLSVINPSLVGTYMFKFYDYYRIGGHRR